MKSSLYLFERLAQGSAGILDLTRHAHNWQRSIRALGGFWTSDFTITSETMNRRDMETFFTSCIARRIIENTFGMVTWEGEIVEMILTVDNVAHKLTLNLEQWHNKVKVAYTYPTFEDSEQGTMAYNPAAISFQDEDQDFGEWETLAGNAVYMIRVVNTDGTTRTGFLGQAFTTTNADDSIYVYEDIERGAAGWSSSVGGKTPASYRVQHVTLAGEPQETAWTENTDSSDIYGESGYLDVIGEAYSAAATAVRDRRLVEHAYPHSLPEGGLASRAGGGGMPDSLYVLCAGYVFSMNRRYRESDTAPTSVSTQISSLIGESEFVSTGTIATNTLSTPISASEVAIRLWDGIEEFIGLGDASGNRWIGGVYALRKFDYKLAETAVTHYWQAGRLLDRAGVPMVPSLILPNIIVEIESPMRWTPPGGAVQDDPARIYIEEVEFIAPDRYRLIPYGV